MIGRMSDIEFRQIKAKIEATDGWLKDAKSPYGGKYPVDTAFREDLLRSVIGKKTYSRYLAECAVRENRKRVYELDSAVAKLLGILDEVD